MFNRPKGQYSYREVGVGIILMISFCLVCVGCTQKVENVSSTEVGIPGDVGVKKDTHSIEALIAALNDKNPITRREAANDLGNINDPLAVEALIAALNDKEPFVRISVIEALGKTKDVRAVGGLISLLKDKELQAYVEKALVEIGPPAVELLVAALKNEDERIRMSAIMILAKIKDTRSVESLIAALMDEDPHIREEAARALGEVKDTRAVEPLITVLRREGGGVRLWAGQALVKIGTPSVLPLITVLKDPDPNVRQEVAALLGEIKDARAVEPLIISLNDSEVGVEISAAMALGKIGEPSVEPLILALKDPSSKIRNNAADILGDINDSRAVEPLIAALRLKSEEEGVRMSAIHALGKMKNGRAVEPLIAALKDEDLPVRLVITEALGEIGSPAVEPLIGTIKSEPSNVRMLAAEALGAIKDARAVDFLIVALKDENLVVIAGAHRFFIERGEIGSETILIKALDEYGSGEMAENYLNCGNSVLETAAREWANDNGYMLMQSPGVGGGGPRWGNNQ